MLREMMETDYQKWRKLDPLLGFYVLDFRQSDAKIF